MPHTTLVLTYELTYSKPFLQLIKHVQSAVFHEKLNGKVTETKHNFRGKKLHRMNESSNSFKSKFYY